MKKRWVILPAALLVLLAAFLLLDFRLMTSQTAMNSETASSRSGDTNTPWEFSPAVTGLYVEGKGRLAEALQARVKDLIQNQEPIGQITAIDAPADRMDIPILYAEIIPLKHFWTPLYARSEYRLVVAYASNGDTSFRKQAVVHFQSSGDEPFKQYKASFTFQDTSIGVISARGYQHYLAEKMAGMVQQSLQN